MAQQSLMTVRGPIAPEDAGITDGHSHLWLSPVEGAQAGFVLNDLPLIAAELGDFRRAGGRTQIDCQPGGCGRDGRALRQLSEMSGVHIVACTGYHLRKYYPPDYWLWSADAEAVYTYLRREINEGLDETRDFDAPIRAGFIKIAFEEDVTRTPLRLLDAVAACARDTGVSLEIHTERGLGAEEIVRRFAQRGLGSQQLVLCHMDKRPDFDLHHDLCRAGVMLEYDTFFRPKYEPDRHVWKLLERLVEDGLDTQIVLATDLADAALWRRFGGGPGLAGFVEQLIPRLQSLGFDASTVGRLVGGNIAERLARPVNNVKDQEHA